MTKRDHLDQRREAVLDLYAQRRTNKEIVALTGYHSRTVNKIVRAARDEGDPRAALRPSLPTPASSLDASRSQGKDAADTGVGVVSDATGSPASGAHWTESAEDSASPLSGKELIGVMPDSAGTPEGDGASAGAAVGDIQASTAVPENEGDWQRRYYPKLARQRQPVSDILLPDDYGPGGIKVDATHGVVKSARGTRDASGIALRLFAHLQNGQMFSVEDLSQRLGVNDRYEIEKTLQTWKHPLKEIGVEVFWYTRDLVLLRPMGA